MLKMIPRFSESVMDPWGKKFLWDSRDSTTSKYKIEEHIFQGQFELASIHRICLTGRKPANFGLKSDSNHSIKWKCKPATWFIWQSSAWTRKRSREHVFPLPTLCRWMKYLQTPFINYGRFTIWATTASRWSKSAGSTMPTKKNEARSDSESKQSILILKGNRVETKKRGEISTELKLKAGVHGTNATTQSASISSHWSISMARDSNEIWVMTQALNWQSASRHFKTKTMDAPVSRWVPRSCRFHGCPGSMFPDWWSAGGVWSACSNPAPSGSSHVCYRTCNRTFPNSPLLGAYPRRPLRR